MDPIYLKIRRAIRDGILTGAHRTGERLPSESKLAEQYATTRTTVRHALSQLVFEGLVMRHNGRGSFVCDRPVIHSPIDSRQCLTFEEQVALTGRIVSYGAGSLAQVKAGSALAATLAVAAGSTVFRMERLRLIEEQAVCLEERFLPPPIGLKVTGQMLATQSAHRFVAAIIGQPIPTITVSITAEAASATIATKLELPVGAPVLVRDNTHHLGNGKVVCCGRSTFRGDIRTDYVLGRPIPA
ncbi:MAG: GntR family transcriptional regulator [Janthinobacterium lividum]